MACFIKEIGIHVDIARENGMCAFSETTDIGI